MKPRRRRAVYLHENPLHAFRRNHTGDYRCTADEVRTMMCDASDEAQDSKPLPRVRMDELCTDTVRSYRNLYNVRHSGHPWHEEFNPERTYLTLPLWGERGNTAPQGDGRDAAMTFENLTDREKVAIKLAAENGRVTRRDLENATGTNRTTARNTLKELVDKGLLNWIGINENDPNQYYTLAN